MKITILSLFPEMFSSIFRESIVKIAQEKKLVEINIVNIRDFGIGKHKTVDDTPYGGGAGMVLRVDVVAAAIAAVRIKPSSQNYSEKVILLDARGKTFKQEHASSLSKIDHLILIAGHYEGFDERIIKYVDECISLGDFVLTGGEIPAMAITDAIVRLIPGVIKVDSHTFESFSPWDASHNLLDYPSYTKPADFENQLVPEILLSGDHGKISEWRKAQALHDTKKNRPDLLEEKA